MHASKKILAMAAFSSALLTNCSGARGPETTPPEPTVIVRESPAKPCHLPTLPKRPRTLDGEAMADGRVALKPETLTALNLWLSAAYEYMVAAEVCR